MRTNTRKFQNLVDIPGRTAGLPEGIAFPPSFRPEGRLAANRLEAKPPISALRKPTIPSIAEREKAVYPLLTVRRLAEYS